MRQVTSCGRVATSNAASLSGRSFSMLRLSGCPEAIISRNRQKVNRRAAIKTEHQKIRKIISYSSPATSTWRSLSIYALQTYQSYFNVE